MPARRSWWISEAGAIEPFPSGSASHPIPGSARAGQWSGQGTSVGPRPVALPEERRGSRGRGALRPVRGPCSTKAGLVLTGGGPDEDYAFFLCHRSRLDVEVVDDLHVVAYEADWDHDQRLGRRRLITSQMSGSSQGELGCPERLCQTSCHGPAPAASATRLAVSVTCST